MNSNTDPSENQKSSIIDPQSSIPLPATNPLLSYLDSLAEISDIFQLPTPPPPISHLRSLLDQRIGQLESEFQQHDPSAPDLEARRAAYQQSRTRIWTKILQLNEAHRHAAGLKFPTEFICPVQNHPAPVPAPSQDHAQTVPKPSQNRAESVPKPSQSTSLPSKSAISENPANDIINPEPPAPSQARSSGFSQPTRPPAPTTPESPAPAPKHQRMDQLPDHEKAIVIDHIEESANDAYVALQLAKPAPHGLGRKFTRQSVKRFRISHHADLAEKRQRLAQRLRNKSIEQADTNDDYREAALNCFHARLFEAAIDPNCPLKDIPSLARALQQLQATQIAQRKLAPSEEKQPQENETHFKNVK